MEVSVIGTSQVQIGRNEATFNELRKLRASGGRNRIDLIRNPSRLRFCLKAVAPSHAAQVSAQFSKAKDGVKMFVGLPLDVLSDCQVVNHARAVEAGLKALKLLGVEGVELPLWWGVVEKEKMGMYDWAGYLSIAEMVKRAGLKLHVSFCFQGSKEAKLGLPKWVSDIGEIQPDIYFMDKAGKSYKECLSIAVDDVPVFGGKTGLEVYKGFCESFKASFAPYLGSTITGITMGLGPDGELKYPSHHRKAPNGAHKGVGEFQCYDKNMLSNLKNHAEASGNPLWGLGGPHDVPSYNESPDASTFFKDNGGSWESSYGNFFLSWYSSQLVSHGDALLSLASTTFSDKDVTVSGVVPLMHSWCIMQSHPAELTAGFYNTATRDGYKAVSETFAKNSSKMIVSGMDMSDMHQPQGSLSSPESLLSQIMASCLIHNVKVSGQNSSISQGLETFSVLKRNLIDDNMTVDLFTYQRMGALFFSPEHFHSFTELVRSLNQPSLGFYDFPAETVKKAEVNQATSGAQANRQMQTA